MSRVSRASRFPKVSTVPTVELVHRVQGVKGCKGFNGFKRVSTVSRVLMLRRVESAHTIITHFTHARRHPYPRSQFCFLCAVSRCQRRWVEPLPRTQCRGQPPRSTEPGQSHRGVERSGEAEGTGTTGTPSPLSLPPRG